MLDKLDRWIELLSQSGKNTKQQVLDEMKIEREKYLDYEFDKAIIQQTKELGGNNVAKNR